MFCILSGSRQPSWICLVPTSCPGMAHCHPTDLNSGTHNLYDSAKTPYSTKALPCTCPLQTRSVRVFQASPYSLSPCLPSIAILSQSVSSKHRHTLSVRVFQKSPCTRPIQSLSVRISQALPCTRPIQSLLVRFVSLNLESKTPDNRC